MVISVKMFVIVFVIVFVFCLLIIRLATRGYTAHDEEQEVFKSFVEKMMKDDRLLDSNGSPIKNIEILDKLSGSFEMPRLKKDLDLLYKKPNCIIRLIDNKMAFEII